MRYYADFHIHSRFSRATSRDLDLPHLVHWGARKGLSLLGTGDITHPGWRKELREGLVEAEDGTYRLPPDAELLALAGVPPACRFPVRFTLTGEISTIYKRDGRTRKVHHVVHLPGFEAADRFAAALGRIGNLLSDGRPILGLDSRDLLEILLEADSQAFLVPAHIWTPWFAVLGSQSGFDNVDHCYGDLSGHIFALETGLSSDPAMNWRVSSLDRFRLVSSSDAHSPQKLGREACILDTGLAFADVRRAMETGDGWVGTVEFFPEEGKYHLDGHRACGVCLNPGQTRQAQGKCSVCGKPVTVGVMHRVEDLADRAVPLKPPTGGLVRSLVPLPEILGEILGVGPYSKSVRAVWERLLATWGHELHILDEFPLDEMERMGVPLLSEAIRRLRDGVVHADAGYDGEYGTVHLFGPGELASLARGSSLFGPLEAFAPLPRMPVIEVAPPRTGEGRDLEGASSGMLHLPTVEASPFEGLDAEQRFAVEQVDGPVLIVAGPGSGKTRTLTRRIAHMVLEHGIPAEQCLAVTFTRRAADEMRERLAVLMPIHGLRIPVFTFHALGLAILRAHAADLGLPLDFSVSMEADRVSLLASVMGITEMQASRLLAGISLHKRTDGREGEKAEVVQALDRALRMRGLVDFDDLVGLPAALLERDAQARASWQARYPYVSVDEYQDVDELQVRLIRALCPLDANICVIGDPDQSIYGFRGSSSAWFQRFRDERPATREVRLLNNYRSTGSIVEAAVQVITSSHPEDRVIRIRKDPGSPIHLHDAATDKAEAESVVQALEQILGGHSLFSLDSGRSSGQEAPYCFADIAILYRTESQATALEVALARSGMPFQVRSHRRLCELPHALALAQILRSMDEDLPLAEMLAIAGTRMATTGDQPDLGTFMERMRRLAAHVGTDRARFLSELALGLDVDTWDPRADRISLLTIHASKGLEFSVVFIVGCEDGILPFRLQSPPGDASTTVEDEERRLFYVGMTRARDHLFLCRARKRTWRGRVRLMEPSPFLRDIAPRLLRVHESTWKGREPKPVDPQVRLF